MDPTTQSVFFDCDAFYDEKKRQCHEEERRKKERYCPIPQPVPQQPYCPPTQPIPQQPSCPLPRPPPVEEPFCPIPPPPVAPGCAIPRQPPNDKYYEEEEEEEQSSGSNWWIWILLGVAILALIIYLVWRNNQKPENPDLPENPNVPGASVANTLLQNQNFDLMADVEEAEREKRRLREELDEQRQNEVNRLEDENRRKEDQIERLQDDLVSKSSSTPSPQLASVNSSNRPVGVELFASSPNVTGPSVNDGMVVKYNNRTGNLYLCKQTIVIQNDGTRNVIQGNCKLLTNMDKNMFTGANQSHVETVVRGLLRAKMPHINETNFEKEELIMLRGVVNH